MRRKQSVKKEKERDITHQTGVATEPALGVRDVYPAEEFAGFDNFGEFPEWHAGQVARRVEGEACEEIANSVSRK